MILRLWGHNIDFFHITSVSPSCMATLLHCSGPELVELRTFTYCIALCCMAVYSAENMSESCHIHDVNACCIIFVLCCIMLAHIIVRRVASHCVPYHATHHELTSHDIQLLPATSPSIRHCTTLHFSKKYAKLHHCALNRVILATFMSRVGYPTLQDTTQELPYTALHLALCI